LHHITKIFKKVSKYQFSPYTDLIILKRIKRTVTGAYFFANGHGYEGQLKKLGKFRPRNLLL
jgi:hypothetical protein